MTGAPTVTNLLVPLAEVDDRGIHADDGSYSTWRRHVQHGADLAAALRARLDPDRPPHIGILLGNTPLFSALLVAAGLSGMVAVGLNPTRRGAALRRDIVHADCQLVITDADPQSFGPDIAPVGIPVIDANCPDWSHELAAFLSLIHI